MGKALLEHGSSRRGAWVVVLVIAACGAGQPDRMSARIDGKPTNFEIDATAQAGKHAGQIVHVVFGGSSSQDSSKPAFSIDVQIEQGIKPGSFSKWSEVAANYYWQTPSGTRSYTRNSEQPFTVHFTRVDAQRLEGSFAGEVMDPEAREVVKIGDGRFSLPVTGG